MLFSNIFLPSVFNIVPIGIKKYKTDKISYIELIIWAIVSLTVSSLIIIKMEGVSLNIPIVLASTIITSIFNTGFIKDWINPKEFFKLVFMFTIFMFSQIFQLIPMALFNINEKSQTPLQEELLTLFSTSCVIFIAYRLYKNDIKKEFKEFKEKYYNHIDSAFKYWFLGMTVMIISNLLIRNFTPAIASNENGIQETIKSVPVLSLITVGILGPIAEELTFRKAFQKAFNSKLIFVLISGLVFGSLHVILTINSAWDLLLLIPYCSMGLAFSYTLFKTNNIFSTIFMHIFHNTVLTTLSVMGSMVIML